MIVLVDTTIWSLALRRREADLNPQEKAFVEEWASLVRRGEAGLIGPIRQEVLSGIRDEKVFEAIQTSLGDFRYFTIHPADYDLAASFFNRCRSKGVAATAVNLLICAVAYRCNAPIFTTDPDFGHMAPHTGIQLYQP